MLCTIKVLSVVHNQGSILSVVHNQGIAGYPYIVGPLLPMHNGTIADGP